METVKSINTSLKMLMLIAASVMIGSCGRVEDWLDVKRNNADVMPRTGRDLQALMDNQNIVNGGYPVLGQISSDNLYVPDDRLGTLRQIERNAYLWRPDLFEAEASSEFANPNVRIAYANIVLERIDQTPDLEVNSAAYNNIKGQALFLRAFATYYLTQMFCKTYNPATAAADMGLQLRDASDPNLSVPRSSVKETYEWILSDTHAAFDLLDPEPLFTTRSSKVAAAALLAKVYLVMGDYAQSLEYASLALQGRYTLLDFNSDFVNPQSTFRFPAFSVQNPHPEVIFHAETVSMISVSPTQGVGFADTLLYDSYEHDDLRKTLFFREHANGLHEPVGRYSGVGAPFCGIAVNELYLIRAECNARSGNSPAAMEDLNRLLEKRYKTGTFIPLTAEDGHSALALVLEERRKELAFTGQLRWEDLRRLTPDPAWAVTLKRIAEGQLVELPADDRRYVFPFPDLEIQLSGVIQNER